MGSSVRIALTGDAYSGKTTLGRYLEEAHGFYFIDYTGLLKRLAASSLSAIGVTVTPQDIAQNKKRYRGFLQELGTVLGFDHGYGVTDLLEEWARRGSPEPVVFDNVRFLSQHALLSFANFRLVRIVTPQPVRVKRAMAVGISASEIAKWNEHPAEAGLPSQPGEVSISGYDPVSQMAESLIAALEAR